MSSIWRQNSFPLISVVTSLQPFFNFHKLRLQKTLRIWKYFGDKISSHSSVATCHNMYLLSSHTKALYAMSDRQAAVAVFNNNPSPEAAHTTVLRALSSYVEWRHQHGGASGCEMNKGMSGGGGDGGCFCKQKCFKHVSKYSSVTPSQWTAMSIH